MEETKEFYSITELAKRLTVHPDTVRKLYRTGKIPYHRFGKSIRFAKNDVDRFIEETRFYND